MVRLTPRVDAAYRALAGEGHPVNLVYAPEWLERGLQAELETVAKDELRRGTTLVGPHRDELEVSLSAMPARTHASQGEQRTLSLALRIAGHHELAAVAGTSPVLLLDDVFSELDVHRSASLLGLLVADQTMITTASPTPELDEVTATTAWTAARLSSSVTEPPNPHRRVSVPASSVGSCPGSRFDQPMVTDHSSWRHRSIG